MHTKPTFPAHVRAAYDRPEATAKEITNAIETALSPSLSKAPALPKRTAR